MPKIMPKHTVLCPIIDETNYEDIQLEWDEIWYWRCKYGVTQFAVLDACDLSYHGVVDLP